MAELKKWPRNSKLLSGEWRLASVDEVKKNLAKIKGMGVLNSWDIARLLDGCVKEKYSGVKQHDISNMKHMLLFKTNESRPSGNSSYEEMIHSVSKMYSEVKWTSQGGQAAVLLSCEDKMTEAICFVLYGIVQNVKEDGKREEELHKLTESLEEKFRNGRTVLHYAVDLPHNQQHGEYVAKCLKDNFKYGKELIKAADIYGRTALHFAAFHGNTQLCQFLIQHCEMRVDEKDQNGENLLHFAVKGKTAAVFQSLCALPGVNELIGSQDAQGKTALHKAAAQGSTEMITTLLDISQANIEEGNIRLLFIRQADLFGRTALLEAARGGHEEAVKLLLEKGSNPLCERSSDGRTALHYAVQLSDDKKTKQMAELLLKHLEHNVDKFLLLCTSATGIGTAEEYPKREKRREKQWCIGEDSDTAEKYLETQRESTIQKPEDLLSRVNLPGYEKIALEHLVNRGVNIPRITQSRCTAEEKQRIDDCMLYSEPLSSLYAYIYF